MGYIVIIHSDDLSELHGHGCPNTRACLSKHKSMAVQTHEYGCPNTREWLTKHRSMAVQIHKHGCRNTRKYLSKHTSMAAETHENACPNTREWLSKHTLLQRPKAMPFILVSSCHFFSDAYGVASQALLCGTSKTVLQLPSQESVTNSLVRMNEQLCPFAFRWLGRLAIGCCGLWRAAMLVM